MGKQFKGSKVDFILNDILSLQHKFMLMNLKIYSIKVIRVGRSECIGEKEIRGHGTCHILLGGVEDI